MKKALIFDGQVFDVVEPGSEFPVAPAMQWVNVADGVSGATHYVVDGVVTVRPAPPVVIPASITMRQARLALLNAGLLASVNAGIGAMPQAVQIEWEYAATVDRASPLVATLASALGLNGEALDALFTQGASL